VIKFPTLFVVQLPSQSLHLSKQNLCKISHIEIGIEFGGWVAGWLDKPNQQDANVLPRDINGFKHTNIDGNII